MVRVGIDVIEMRGFREIEIGPRRKVEERSDGIGNARRATGIALVI